MGSVMGLHGQWLKIVSVSFLTRAIQQCMSAVVRRGVMGVRQYVHDQEEIQRMVQCSPRVSVH